MSENHRNTTRKPEEFLRYRSKRMAAKERNDFEKHLQKDPFAEEAAEGFENIDPGQAEKDLLMLQKRLSKRTYDHRIPWYGIAASVAVLMVIVTVLVVMNKREPAEIAYVPSEQNKVEEKETEVEEIVVQPAMKIPENVSVRTRDKTAKEVVQQKTEAEIPVSDEDISVDNAKEEVKPVEGLKMAEEPYPVFVKEKPQALRNAIVNEAAGKATVIRGRVLSSDDNLPVPGASVVVKGTKYGTVTDTGGNFSLPATGTKNSTLVASMIGMEPAEFKASGDSILEIRLDPSVSDLSEIVVVGYGAAKKNDNEDEYVQTSPEPVGGRTEFDRYIRDNIRRPDTPTSGQRVVVVLDFIVRNNGTIDNIKVVRSPGTNFSDEAIRLLKEGPAWKPATENGNAITDNVRLRIVFR